MEEFRELSWEEALQFGDWVELSEAAPFTEWVDYYLADFDNEDLEDFWEWFDEEYSDIA